MATDPDLARLLLRAQREVQAAGRLTPGSAAALVAAVMGEPPEGQQRGTRYRLRSTGEIVVLVRMDIARRLATVERPGARIGVRVVALSDLQPLDGWPDAA